MYSLPFSTKENICLRFIIKYNNGINANETHYKGLIVLQRSLGVGFFLDVIGLFWHSFVHLM